MIKTVLRTHSQMLKKKDGTINIKLSSDDEANQTSADECDIKKILYKYGCIPDDFLNKTKQPLYTDATNLNLTMNERIAQKEEIYAYFKEMPPNIRKEYKDNPEILYQSIMYGKGLENMVKFGILTQEKVEEMKQQKIQEQNKKYEQETKIAELQREIENIKKGDENANQQNSEQN